MLRLHFQIHSIGISITTMEDVFHKVGEYGEAKSKDGIFSRDSEKFDFTCENNITVYWEYFCEVLLITIKHV